MSTAKHKTDPISYYLRHPMHCGVVRFLHWEEIGIVECSHWEHGLANPPQPCISIGWGGKTWDFRPDDALPLATARKIWAVFLEAGWEFRREDRGGVRMTGWGK